MPARIFPGASGIYDPAFLKIMIKNTEGYSNFHSVNLVLKEPFMSEEY